MNFFSKIFPKSNKYLELEVNYAKLQKEFLELKAINSKLELRISELEKKNGLALIKKDSHNSSLSPSSDIVKKTKVFVSRVVASPVGRKDMKDIL